jgi:beta-glucanase (GH16 family)
LGKLKQSMYTHGQGYHECRCSLQQKPGWWSAFWLQSPMIGASLDPKTSGVEVDIMESFNPGSINGHNVFTGGYGQDLRRIKVGGMEGVSTDEFHRFGLLWDDTGYTYFVDGVENGKIEDFFCDYPLFILISTEVKGYRKEQHVPSQEAYDSVGDTFLVDYVRVFEKR